MANYNFIYPGQTIDQLLTTAYYLKNAGYIFLGSASSYSGTPTQRAWLIAPSGFTGFGFSEAIPIGSIGICLYNGTSWSGVTINVVTVDETMTAGSDNPISSGTVYDVLSTITQGISAQLDSLELADATDPSDILDVLTVALKMTKGGFDVVVSSLNILSATASKAGLMSAADKIKLDGFVNNIRSMVFADTTPSSDLGTKIVESLKWTVDNVQEVITTLTILAASSEKAGLMSAADKAYVDGLPAILTSLSNSINSIETDLLNYYTKTEVDTLLDGKQNVIDDLSAIRSGAAAGATAVQPADMNSAISSVRASIGYYECSTAAATAAKIVSASGYTLTNGGCIRIKMTNENTADNATLNINGTGAKALYYNGAQASATNTWEAGEVLEVYYDGTQYQCASGGGGKFATGEAVKDVSIIDSMSNNHTDIVSGKAMYDMFTQSERTITQADATLTNTILKSNGQTQSLNGYITSPVIPLDNANRITATGLQYWSASYMGLGIFDSSNAVLYVNEGTSIDIDLADYPTASYIRICCASSATNVNVKIIKYAGIANYTANHVENGNKMPISSDAVYKDIWSNFVSSETEYSATADGIIIKANGSTQGISGYSTSGYIAVDTSMTLTAVNIFPNDSTYHGIHFYDANKASASTQPQAGGNVTIDMKDYPDVKFVRFCGQTSASPKLTIKVGEDLLDEMKETLPKVTEIGGMIDTTYETRGLVQSKQLTNNLAASFTTPLAVSAVDKYGLIESITIDVKTAGNAHFGVGKLDQSLIPVLTKEFDVTIPSVGLNTVDVSDLRIDINIGEQLFFYYRAIDGVNFNYVISSDSADAEKNCPYGPITGLSYYNVSGKYLLATLSFTVLYVDSIFALKKEVELMDEKITMLEANSFVYDNQGNPYKLRISNGEVIALPQVFTNVVVLGNSLTRAEYTPNIGWYGDFSMCCTTLEASWTYKLQRILRKKEPTAVVNGLAMNPWERAGDGNRDINSIPSLKAKLDAILSSDTNLIIFRTGENATVNDVSVYTQEILNLIDYCLGVAPSATVFVCGLFWPNANKDAATLAAANARGYNYITAGRGFSDYQELLGDYMVDVNDGVEKMIGRACLTHTADHGFYLWTNHVAKNIGYSAYMLDELYNITINSSLANGYKIKDKQSPYQALVTILVSESTQPNINVVDASNNAISTSVHSVSNVGSYTFAFTFIQPDSDVTVTLS